MAAIKVRDCIEDMLTTFGFSIGSVYRDGPGVVCDLAVLVHPLDLKRLKNELLKDTPTITYHPISGTVNYRGYYIQESFMCEEGSPKLIKIL